MKQVNVLFENGNLIKTLEYINRLNLDDIDELNKPITKVHLVNKIKELAIGEFVKTGKKDYKYFEHLTHFPATGVMVSYHIGDFPKDVGSSFCVDIHEKCFIGNIVACLYCYLD